MGRVLVTVVQFSTDDILFSFFFYWLCGVFIAVHGLSLVAVSGGYSSLRCAGFSLWWLLLLWSAGFSGMGSRAQAQ